MRSYSSSTFELVVSMFTAFISYWSLIFRVVDCAALGPDIQQMPAGDLTEIGERGITVSVGQRARISIARALYSQAQIYILDDCFSALDASVSQYASYNFNIYR